MRTYVLPLICFAFAMLSLAILQSIYPSGVETQAIAFFLGFGAYAVASSVPFVFWKYLAKFIFIMICVILLGTLLVGKTTKGSTRWVSLGSMQFQPSQLAKPLLGLYLCGAFIATQKKRQLKHTLLPLAGGLIPLVLVFLQPDLGTTLILASVFGFSLFFSQVPLRIVGGLIFLAALTGIAGWTFFFHDYQKQRLLSFLSPAEDSLGQGYHADQAVIAVGSGKFFGRGLGHGVQSGLRFLPERQTDFVFASYAEELGFVGVFLLFILYAALLFSLWRMGEKIQGPVGKAFSYTIVGATFIQASMNIGMNIGLLPIAGVTLPLISLGGSSVIALLFSFGVIASAYRANPRRHLVEIRSFV